MWNCTIDKTSLFWPEDYGHSNNFCSLVLPSQKYYQRGITSQESWKFPSFFPSCSCSNLLPGCAKNLISIAATQKRMRRRWGRWHSADVRLRGTRICGFGVPGKATEVLRESSISHRLETLCTRLAVSQHLVLGLGRKGLWQQLGVLVDLQCLQQELNHKLRKFLIVPDCNSHQSVEEISYEPACIFCLHLKIMYLSYSISVF